MYLLLTDNGSVKIVEMLLLYSGVYELHIPAKL